MGRGSPPTERGGPSHAYSMRSSRMRGHGVSAYLRETLGIIGEKAGNPRELDSAWLSRNNHGKSLNRLGRIAVLPRP
jgi:hypothetical protein